MKGFTFLTTEEVVKVHDATLQILENIGVSSSSEKFKELLLSNGCKEENGRIKLPADIVNKFLQKAPSTFKMRRRDDEPDLEIGARIGYSQICSGTPHVLDLETGKRRSYRLKDLEDLTRLGDALPNIDIVSCGVPTDVDEHGYMTTEVATMLRNTSKPARVPIESTVELPYIKELLALIAGGMDEFRENPFLYLEVSPLSPLDFAGLPADAIIELAQAGIPTGLIPCNMMGATGPMSLIGAVAQQNAEVVTGIVAAQMVNPGLPVIMSPRVTFIDMKSGAGLWAAPEVGLAGACSIQLAQHYNIPVSVSAFSVASKVPDQQSGYERCFNYICATLAGCDIYAAAGSLDNALIACYGQLVIDSEIASMGKRITRKIEVTDEALAVDVIAEVVNSKSSFLEQKHTRKFLRAGELWAPQISDRSTFAHWNEKGESIAQKARNTAADLLKTREPIMEPAAEKEIDRIIQSARK